MMRTGRVTSLRLVGEAKDKAEMVITLNAGFGTVVMPCMVSEAKPIGAAVTIKVEIEP